MPPPWVSGAQVRILGEIHGQQTVNVLHFATNTQINDPPALNALLLQLVDAIGECIITTLLPAVSIDWRYVQTEGKQIFPVTSDPVIDSGTPANVGQLGVASHSFAASQLNIRTGQGGRRGRGRIFLPPPGEAQTTASLIDEPTLVLLAAFAACVAGKFIGGSATEDWRIGVLSRKDLNSIIGNFNAAFREATQISPVAAAAIMGTRKRGRGN